MTARDQAPGPDSGASNREKTGRNLRDWDAIHIPSSWSSVWSELGRRLPAIAILVARSDFIVRLPGSNRLLPARQGKCVMINARKVAQFTLVTTRPAGENTLQVAHLVA